MRVTIREVAREAGVSVATVSRVLNGSGQASATTRAKIHEVADRLRYAPNEAARSLIRSSTRTVGVLLPDLHGEFFSELIRGIDQRARQDGFHLLISNFHADAGEMDVTVRAMRGRVDTLILMCPDIDTREILAEGTAGTPTVLLNASSREIAGCDSVCVDNVGGARAMVRHLVRHGYRRIAMITGPERNHDSRERLRGYRTVLRAAGLPVLPELEIVGDFTESAGYAAAQQFLALEEWPRAIFAANDAMAVGALSALRDAGVRVPEDIALAGFDDIPIARYLTPPLSSVHVAIDELGRRATELALAAARRVADSTSRPSGRRKGKQDTLRTTLVVRSSCGAGLGRRARGDSRNNAQTRSTTRGRAPRDSSSQEARE
jgi:LacI family transcriptional regulator, galactose operon repressor